MARKPIRKEIVNSKLLKEYASWIYCDKCNNTVAYLCYVTYDLFNFEYTCNCGNCGKVNIEFEHNKINISYESLKIIKNRLCCPTDNSPLFTIVDKNIENCNAHIVCNSCNTEYKI